MSHFEDTFLCDESLSPVELISASFAATVLHFTSPFSTYAATLNFYLSVFAISYVEIFSF